MYVSPAPHRLVVLYGTGIQLLCMAASSIVLVSHLTSRTTCMANSHLFVAQAMFGMLSPSSRGSLITAAILLFVFFG